MTTKNLFHNFKSQKGWHYWNFLLTKKYIHQRLIIKGYSFVLKHKFHYFTWKWLVMDFKYFICLNFVHQNFPITMYLNSIGYIWSIVPKSLQLRDGNQPNWCVYTNELWHSSMVSMKWINFNCAPFDICTAQLIHQFVWKKEQKLIKTLQNHCQWSKCNARKDFYKDRPSSVSILLSWNLKVFPLYFSSPIDI